MAPKKKPSGSKSTKNRSVSSKRKNIRTSSSPSPSEVEDEEIDTEKKVSKHKSFGKFRCLTETTSNPDSGLDTEYEPIQTEVLEQTDGELYDSILISSDAEMGDAITMEYTDMEGESVEIIASEISHQLSDLHMYNPGEYYLEHTVPADDLSCEQEVEISNNDNSDHEGHTYTSGDESAVNQAELSGKKPAKEKGSKNGKSTLKKTKRVQSNKKVTKPKKNGNEKKALESDSLLAFENIRRSVRIKCKETSKIEDQPKTKQKKNGKNTVDSDTSSSSFGDPERSTDSSGLALSVSEYESDNKPVKVKSRWRRSSELEMENFQKNNCSDEYEKEEFEDPLKTFVHLKENLYLTPKFICKEAKKMACDCVLTVEEIARGEFGCGEDCLNRLLMIECGMVCPVNERCSNKKFQKCDFAPCEVFRTNKKGLGIRATADIPYGQFILEYVGEVIGPDEFEERATDYSRDKNPHHYFMALRADAVIDATAKGNISRFINHSCDPNAETQKWTVNGELRIGFFSKRTIACGEEITFDYQFQRYGKDAQKCLCEAPSCRGWLGAEPEEEVDEEEEEEEEVEEAIEEPVEEVVEPKVEPEVIEETPPILDEKPPVLEIEPTDELHTITSVPTEEITMPVITPIEQPQLPTPTSLPDMKKVIKKEKKKIIKRKVRKEIIFENVDVDNEIEMLVQSGLKNQAHTLKLSRLMVRATEVSQRSSLLRILRRGELPCRRLFLDYHGLRLIYGWMSDAQQLCRTDKKRESLRLELLQTLATLPIPNKTMLQDSKVLQTVEKWSKKLEENSSGLDSESNSPKMEMDVGSEPDTPQEVKEELEKPRRPLPVSSEFQIELRETKDIRRSVGMDRDCRKMKNTITRKRGKELIQDIIDLFDDDLDEETKKQKAKQDVDYEVEIIALALKLIEEWAVLKEVFRIPKKERIEQMKEHEREADRVYKSGLDRDTDKRSERSGLYSRYRILKKSRNSKSDFSERERDRNRKHSKSDENNPLKHISKHERRKLFAMQVEQRDMLRQRELQMSLSSDPRFSTPDYTRNMQCVWNQQTGQWTPVTANQTTSPSVCQNRFFNFNTPNFNMPPPPLPPVPIPQQNIPPFSQSPTLNITQLALNNISRTSQLQPMPPAANITTNITNALANLITLSGIQQLTNISGLSNTNTLSNIGQPLSNLPQTAVPSAARVPNIQTVINLPSLQTASQETIVEEDVSQVKFAGPIPPPVKLPPKWKCAKDKYGRPYYYHIKIRISQWEPPEFPPPSVIEYEEESAESSSTSNTSSSSEETTTEESDDEEDDDDDGLAGNKLLLQIRKKFQHMRSSPPPERRKAKKANVKLNLDEEIASECLEMAKTSSLDERLQQEFNLSTNTKDSSKQKRGGLVTDVYIISPRTEEDKMLAKENLRKYKQNKQLLKREREISLESSKSQISITLKRNKYGHKAKLKDLMDLNTEEAKKIKEVFKTSMATQMVNILNPYTKRDCTQGRITTTEDFKHLARKLTFFVMIKQLKNCAEIEELVCSDNVKTKAKGFVKKYMSKYGEIYVRPKDDAEYY